MPGAKYLRSSFAKGRKRRVYRKDNPSFVLRTEFSQYAQVVGFARHFDLSMSEAVRRLVREGLRAIDW